MGCLWMLMLLIAEIFATEFIPVSHCPDVSSDTSLEQASGFVCSDSTDTNHKLHCILEEDNYKLGLVCTRWAWMETNVCPIFSISRGGIDYNRCSGNDTLCPSRVSEYKSFEAYKYPGCFIGKDMLTTTKATTQTTTTKETTQATTTKETTQPTTTTEIKSESPDLPASLDVLTTFFVMSLIVNIILIVIFRKPIKRWFKKCDTYETENTNKHEEHKSETDDDSISQEKVPLKDLQAECGLDQNFEAIDIDIGRIKEENEMLRK